MQAISTDSLFYENELDALRVTVLAIGGNKKAAELLWGVNLKSGEQRVRDCLNPNRDEKFSPPSTSRSLGRGATLDAMRSLCTSTRRPATRLPCRFRRKMRRRSSIAK
jgi:hypothetical protein